MGTRQYVCSVALTALEDDLARARLAAQQAQQVEWAARAADRFADALAELLHTIRTSEDALRRSGSRLVEHARAADAAHAAGTAAGSARAPGGGSSRGGAFRGGETGTGACAAGARP